MALANGLTPKQDEFARAYVECGNACEAYRRAYKPKRMGSKAITVESTRLMQHPSVALVVNNLYAMHQEAHKVTVESLTKELDEDRKDAREAKQYSAAISAVQLKAKLHGLMIEKKDIGLHGVDDAPPLTISVKGGVLLTDMSGNTTKLGD